MLDRVATSRRTFTKEFNLAAVRRLEAGVSMAEVAHGLEVSPSVLQNHVMKATDDLLANTGTVVSSESEGFFSNLHAQHKIVLGRNSAGKE